MDQERRTARYPFKAPAEVIVEQTGETIPVRVKELSSHGCYLDASIPLSAKTSVLVKIFTSEDYFEARAAVVYANPTLGMGLAFRNIDPDFQTVLQRWLLESTQGEYVRTGRRVNSRVAIALEWVDGGRPLRVEGYTVNVGPYGCLVIAPEGLVVGQKVRIFNRVTQKDCEARVARQGQNSAAGWELGLHLTNPSREFWELNF